MSDIEPVEIYRQQYAHFGRMNDILYKLPILFSTLIGGLWFFAFSFIDKGTFLPSVVLLFCAGLSVVFFFVVERFRLAFNGYIDNINKMDGAFKVTISSKIPSTMRLIQISLVLACGLSLASIYYVVSGHASKNREAPHQARLAADAAENLSISRGSQLLSQCT